MENQDLKIAISNIEDVIENLERHKVELEMQIATLRRAKARLEKQASNDSQEGQK